MTKSSSRLAEWGRDRGVSRCDCIPVSSTSIESRAVGAWLEKRLIKWVSGQRKLNTDGAWHWGEREAGFSPLTKVMGTVQQDDHAVHGEDPDGQQADRTHLGGERGVGIVSHTLIILITGPLLVWVLGCPSHDKAASGMEVLA